jgi:hypothetical protein
VEVKKMSDPQDQNQNQNQKKQQQSSPKILIIIGPPTGANQLVTPGAKDGEYKVLVNLGQSRKPAKDTIAVKVYANDMPIGSAQYVKDPMNYVFDNVKLDPSEEITLSVKQIGQEKPDDSLPPVDLQKLKKGAAPKPSQKRFEVIVGPLSSSRINPVTFITRDEQLQKCKGTVVFCLGQKAKINGKSERAHETFTFETGSGLPGDTKPLGMLSLAITLNDHDDTVFFSHIESCEEAVESLLFEP